MTFLQAEGPGTELRLLTLLLLLLAAISFQARDRAYDLGVVLRA